MISFPNLSGNLLAAGTIINSTAAQTESIAYPLANIFSRKRTKVWRSAYQDFLIKNGNAYLDFNIGGGPLLAFIIEKQYRGVELAGRVASEMNSVAGVSDITAAYFPSLGRFNISKAAGTLNLLRATGANKNNSAFGTLGYLGSADSSGLSQNSSFDGFFGTTGKFVIGGSNNQLHYNDGVNRTATIPVGTYTGQELAAEIKYQMDVTSGVTNFRVTYMPFLPYRFQIGRASGTINLRVSVTTNAIWNTIGFTGGVDLTGSADYNATAIRIHTEDGPVIDMGAATSLSFVAIQGTNIQDQLNNIRLQNATSDSWSVPSNTIAPTAVLNDSTNGLGWAYFSFSPQNFRYWRIKITDSTNPNGFVQIGHLFGGNLYTMNYDFNYFGTFTKVRRPYGPSLLQCNLPFDPIIQADKNFLDSFMDSVIDDNDPENNIPFPMLLDPSGLAYPKMIYAVFPERPTFTEKSTGLGGSQWSSNDFIVRESD